MGSSHALTHDVGANLVVVSGSFLHGNENNANRPDDVVGTGAIGGYAVVNLNGTYHVLRSLDVFLRLDNLLDRNYATAGFLTDNSFNPDGSFRDDPDDWTNENAVSPAQPRAVWVGARLHWD
ncbi:MAG TPA: hypothetical protein VHV80_11000 [Steroidobacteraceae bacterium]|jgi:outer membrane receptor protein involved in Fe transport|nr:hypothetical protein [Steroidobacteraceae bacterium]